MIKKAVIPAAGYGTRFLPITKSLPKEMLPIIDRPTIEFIVNEAIASGITDILLVVSSNKNAIVDYFDRNLELETILKAKNKNVEFDMISHVGEGANIHFVRQKEQLGLGHAVLQAATFVGNEPFAVLLGDDMYVNHEYPAIKQMIDTYYQVNASILGTMEVPKSQTNLYGITSPLDGEIGRLKKLKSVVEKPNPEDAPSQSAIGGRYILSPKIFDYLKNQPEGKGNEIQLTDAILRMMEDEDVYSLDLNAKRYDVGNKVDYIEAIVDFALQNDELKADVLERLKKKV
jgi:UTP--glucose-1-phosphate uridylyltransferase